MLTHNIEMLAYAAVASDVGYKDGRKEGMEEFGLRINSASKNSVTKPSLLMRRVII